MATVAVFVCGVEYFAPSNSKCIFRCFELLLLLFQATHSGVEPLVEVLVLQRLVRREVVRTIIFVGDGLFGLSALFGRLLDGMFVVCRFVLLYGWVSVEVGFGAALMPPL